MKLSKNILVLLLSFVSIGAMAQPRIAREISFGVIGGSVLSSYSFAPKVTQGQALGYTAGVGARYIEEKYFGLQAEFLVTRRGMKDRFDEYPDLKFQRNLTYIEMPVLAHVYFSAGKKNEIAFDIGPKLGLYLFDKSESQLFGEDWERIQRMSSHGYKHHDIDVTKKFDYGIQAGLGYEFKFNKELSLQLQGRYYFGLGNMFPDSKADVFENSNNQQIQIVAALWFRQHLAKYKIKKKLKQYSK